MSSRRVSWGFAFVGRTEIDGHAHLGFELRIARFLAFEAQLVLRRTDRRKIKRDAENQDPDAEHSGRAERVQPFLGALHRLLLKVACTPNWIGREGSSTWT